MKRALALITLLAGMIAFAPAANAAQPDHGYRCAISYSLTGGTPAQQATIARAVLITAKASGQWYELVPNNAQLTITVSTRADSALLNIDGTADSGYTLWTPGHADIALLNTTPNVWLGALTMHELMLSRHLYEGPDPGGLLGHIVHVHYYSAADLAMLANTGCI